MFFVLKRKRFFFFVLAIFVFVCSAAAFFAVKEAVSPKAVCTMVIDAGHGGVDGGAEGDLGVSESYLNLQYALALEKIAQSFGFSVVMTRSDMNGLYSPLASNKKRSEMEKRKSIIESSGADIVVSIHMNSFPSSEARGAQVYYADGSATGEALAQSVQDSLSGQIAYAKKTAKVGDFFILNCTQSPSILVECGFLSNAEEEALLVSEDYRQNFCYQLFCGILKFYAFA